MGESSRVELCRDVVGDAMAGALLLHLLGGQVSLVNVALVNVALGQDPSSQVYMLPTKANSCSKIS